MRTPEEAMQRLAGTYVFRFSGFDRDNSHARHLVGVGVIELSGDGKVTSGKHNSTNSPMSGQLAAKRGLKHSAYKLTGSYEIIEAGPPISAKIDIKFDFDAGDSDDRPAMSDTFKIIQAGVHRFWLISSNPQEEDLKGGKKKIQELVIGEAVKVEADTW
jgi:hypothetical protein